MRKFLQFVATALMIGGLAISSATAAPLNNFGKGATAPGQSLIQKTHGWHRFCEQGPARFHRHVPGRGNVRCFRGRPGGGFRRCRRWRNECSYRWGGGWRYRRCMRRHGC